MIGLIRSHGLKVLQQEMNAGRISNTVYKNIDLLGFFVKIYPSIAGLGCLKEKTMLRNQISIWALTRENLS